MIRPMTSKDIEHVQQIARVTWRETYYGIIPEELQTTFLEQSYSDMMLLMRMKKTKMLIAESEGVPVGFANITKVDDDGDAELTAMYILPTHQQSGYRQKIISQCTFYAKICIASICVCRPKKYSADEHFMKNKALNY